MYGVRWQAERDTALRVAGRHEEPKRRRRSALPAHSIWWQYQGALVANNPSKRSLLGLRAPVKLLINQIWAERIGLNAASAVIGRKFRESRIAD